MATVTINASTPSTTVNFAVLKATIDKVLEAHRRHQIDLGVDGYQLLFEVAYGGTDGATAAGTTSQAVITYA